MLRQIDDAEDLPLAEQDGEARVVEADLASVRAFPGSRSASTRSVRGDAPQAILKGSPKTLGWEVDEEGEQTAWEMLMGDAMSSTVFEPVDDVAEVCDLTTPTASRTLSLVVYRSLLSPLRRRGRCTRRTWNTGM